MRLGLAACRGAAAGQRCGCTGELRVEPGRLLLSRGKVRGRGRARFGLGSGFVWVEVGAVRRAELLQQRVDARELVRSVEITRLRHHL